MGWSGDGWDRQAVQTHPVMMHTVGGTLVLVLAACSVVCWKPAAYPLAVLGSQSLSTGRE